MLLGTTRTDGTPRISPVEPLFHAHELWISMMWRSTKAVDVARDSRVLLHSIVTRREGDDGEVKMRGRAMAIDDPERRREYVDVVAAALGWRPEEPYFHLVTLDIWSLVAIRYDEAGNQHVMQWPQRKRFVRPIETATSVGEPHSIRDLTASSCRCGRSMRRCNGET